MMQKTSTRKTQPGKKNGHKSKPIDFPERMSAWMGISESFGAVLGSNENETMEPQGTRLGHRPLHTIQRQRMVLQLGQIQGNRHLQRAVISREEDQKKDDDAKHEQKVKELVVANKYEEAVTYILTSYNFTGYNLEFKVVEGHEISGAWATTSGELKKGAKQTLKISKDLFKESFPFIVRTIGHEFQHVTQRSGNTPMMNQPEREFLAWSWEAIDTSVPEYTVDVAAVHAKKALEFFAKLPGDDQKKYAEKKKQLEDLIKKAEKEKAGK